MTVPKTIETRVLYADKGKDVQIIACALPYACSYKQSMHSEQKLKYTVYVKLLSNCCTCLAAHTLPTLLHANKCLCGAHTFHHITSNVP